MKKLTHIFLILILMINILFFYSGYNASGADISLVDWDNVPSGYTNGTVGSLVSIDYVEGADGYPSVRQESIFTGTNSYCFLKSGVPEATYKAYINLTNSYTYIQNINFSFQLAKPSVGNNWFMNFINESGIVLRLRFINAGGLMRISYYDGNTNQVITEGIDNNKYHLSITNNETNILRYELFDDIGERIADVTGTSSYLGASWSSFTGIYLWEYMNVYDATFYIDDINIGTSIPPPDDDTEYYDFEINVFDQETEVPLISYSPNYESPIPYGINYQMSYLSSDLWGDDYLNGDYSENPIQISTEYSIGSWHWINLTYPIGVVNGEIAAWRNYSLHTRIYPDNVFNIYLTRYGQTSDAGWSNCISPKETYCDIFVDLCTDKQIYEYGEQTLIRFYLPEFQEMFNCQWIDGDNYQLWIYDTDDLGYWGETDGGTSATFTYPEDEVFNPDTGGQYTYINWNAPEPTGGVDSYRMYIGHEEGGLFGRDYSLAELDFAVRNATFTPEGNIQSMSPNPAFIGQNVNISWTANNDGKVTYKNLLNPDGTEQTLTTFERAVDGHVYHTDKQFIYFGVYDIKLYVNGQIGFDEVDTARLYVNSTNDTIGSYGYGVEYLQVNPERAIGGYDNMQITYNTLKNDTVVIVKDSRNQRTIHSFLLDKGFGTKNFQLPNRASIGEWNITMHANETLYTTFQVVADENNYIEFGKNSYYDNELFNVKLKHDRKVEIEFLKDGEGRGKNWFLQESQKNYGFFEVSQDIVIPEPGEWTVNLYEVNELVRRELLATDTCVVLEKIQESEYTLEDDDSVPITENPTLRAIIGLLFTVVFLFIPAVIGRFGTGLPTYVYGLSTLLSVVINVLFGLWPSWSLIFILIGILLLIVLVYFSKR